MAELSKLNTVSEIGVSEIQEPIEEDAGLIGPPPLIISGKFGDDDTEENILETEKKRGKKPRAKHRKNKDTINGIMTFEKKEKKGLVYSRMEMEELRFEDLHGQKKKWLEVYCGLCPSVALEYDDLVNSDNNLEPAISFDFDPRPQFQMAPTPPASMGENCCHLPDNSSERFDLLNPTHRPPVNDEISCSAAEEEYSPDYTSDEDYSSIQKPAFLVTGEPDFDSGPPQDGLEYLRRVRWEASQIPDVAIANIEKSELGKEQTIYMPQIPEIMDCPENFLPLKQWEDCFLAYFSELRLGFTQLDLQGSNAENSIEFQSVIFEYFNSFLSGYDSCPSEASSSPHTLEEPSTTSDGLALSSILEMDSAARTSKLKKRISLIENVSTLSREDCLWLFALCVAVDSPLDADTSASLRSLLRKCASLRAVKANADDEVVMLNILATISGRYFGQSEK
ncbi:uncharacterized protein LOC142556222 isoform X1 [Primulina tabacum]|uniref:uncharacterized protein LOC142556222 isoform X1 n=1 Tax=Primulina tabacum TaxID=48773 RepID=UPI003F5A86BC